MDLARGTGYNTNGWNNACKAASSGNTASGTIIGVKGGVYGGAPRRPSRQRHRLLRRAGRM